MSTTAAATSSAEAPADTAATAGWFRPAIVLALLTLPFHPYWIDAEAARRGLGCIVVGVVLVWRPPRLLREGFAGARAAAWPLALLALGVLMSVSATNPWEAVLRLAWYGAVCGALWWGWGQPLPRLLAAVLPTVSLVAVFAIAQDYGVTWPYPAGTDLDGSSTLGNRNPASQLLAVGAIAAVLAHGVGAGVRGAKTWHGAALAVAAACGFALTHHLAGSRGALLALAAATACLLAASTRMRWLPGLAAASVGLVLGWVLAPQPSAPPSPHPESQGLQSQDPQSQGTELQGANGAPSALPPPAPSTVEVRLGLWGAAADLVREAPALGQGPGQFRIQFPRVRDPHEHDLSSYNRAFRTEVRHAHNDPIELTVELGLLGAMLAVLAFGALAWQTLVGDRKAGTRSALGAAGVALPVTALALGATYSALLNAPVALALAALTGAAAGQPGLATAAQSAPQKLPRWARALTPAAGLLVVVCGVTTVLGQTIAAAYPRAVALGQTPDPRHPMSALKFAPWDDQLHGLVARAAAAGPPPAPAGGQAANPPANPTGQDNGAQGLQFAARHALRAHQLAPFHVEHIVLLGELAVARGDLDTARERVVEALALDPTDPQAQLFGASLLYRAGDDQGQGCADALFAAPHPQLREQLASVFEQFRTLADSEGRIPAALRFAAERDFVRTLDAFAQSDDVTTDRNANIMVNATLESFRQFEQQTGSPRDARPYILAAWLELQHGLRGAVIRMGLDVLQSNARLSPQHRDHVAPYLKPLLGLRNWDRFTGS